jgi:hypothetical protein
MNKGDSVPKKFVDSNVFACPAGSFFFYAPPRFFPACTIDLTPRMDSQRQEGRDQKPGKLNRHGKKKAKKGLQE